MSRACSLCFGGGVVPLPDEAGPGPIFVDATGADEDQAMRGMLRVEGEGIGIGLQRHLAFVVVTAEDGGIDAG